MEDLRTCLSCLSDRECAPPRAASARHRKEEGPTSPEETPILILEGWELPLVCAKPSLENASERSLVLEHFWGTAGDTGKPAGTKAGTKAGRPNPGIVVATLSGALQLLLKKERYDRMRMSVEQGQKISIDDFVQTLVNWGYERSAVVEKKGDFSVHGGIVDVYPVACANPLRLEWVADDIESLRFFDSLTQRSCQSTRRAVIHAANEWRILQETGGEVCILDYLACDAVVVLDEPVELSAMFERTKSQDGLIPIPRLDFQEFIKKAQACAQVSLSLLPQSLPGWENASAVELTSHPVEMALDGEKDLPVKRVDALAHDPMTVLAHLERWTLEGYGARLVFQNEGEEKRFFQWVSEQGWDKPWLKNISAVRGRMEEGFVSPSFRMVFLTDQDIFGRAKIRRSVKRFRGTSPLGEFLELNIGDLVVHQRHGIGRYLGIQKIEHEGVWGEYLSIEYANKAKLHMPLDQAYLVSKYLGVGDRPVTIDQLGSKRWESIKARVVSSTLKIARELLEVQAVRESLQGFAYSRETPWQKDFEAAFPYEETPDQMTSIQAVMRDMEQVRPMDRLICGDVGYGKTEVAMRAAFKAVMDHRQVAVLVPTTILAQQHYQTFSSRMADYPVRVEMISRFRHPGQARKILLDTVEGKIDILIGTHRLLQEDIQFKDLGLAIIDEEQRFGVRHKEAFKRLRRLVDVLTLTATPIPRTLYLSLLGAREMSAINTPPQDRLPVETILAEYSDDLIRRVIRYELAREGQVYYVHNRVQTIEKIKETVQKLVPEAVVTCAHGQMDEDLLSEIMSKFMAGKIDVLVTTTIIESGLDIPNANTLIVDRADRFGLSDLYQLRGRVGRFKNKAYAYFLLPKDKVLLDAAKKRLKAIHDFTALGSGFKIAMRDLEIRGAGNILGHQQHGHIAAVGFDLYCQLLRRSVEQLKKVDVPPDTEVQVKLGTDFVIPPGYVPSEAMRLDLYRRISSTVDESQVVRLREEIADRFGRPPMEVELFLEAAKIRILARAKNVYCIEKRAGKWFFRRGRDVVTIDGKLPRSQSEHPLELVSEIKNVLSKLPDASTIGGLREKEEIRIKE